VPESISPVLLINERDMKILKEVLEDDNCPEYRAVAIADKIVKWFLKGSPPKSRPAFLRKYEIPKGQKCTKLGGEKGMTIELKLILNVRLQGVS